jgi:hypothetical protein
MLFQLYKNDLFFNCRTKIKELSKKELSNVTPALFDNRTKSLLTKNCPKPKGFLVTAKEMSQFLILTTY